MAFCWMKDAFYQNLFSEFLFVVASWRWRELFSPTAAQLGLVFWQTTSDSYHFLIQQQLMPQRRICSQNSFVILLRMLLCAEGADILSVQ